MWFEIYKAVLNAPCSTYRGVQMKAELLLCDDPGAFGGEMESWEATAPLRSFRAVVSWTLTSVC
jgi:hypothetical protein